MPFVQTAGKCQVSQKSTTADSSDTTPYIDTERLASEFCSLGDYFRETYDGSSVNLTYC